MNVLIAMAGTPFIQGAAILVPFVAIARIPNQPPFQVIFTVEYGFGATAAQRDTAIRNAANVAKVAYESAHGITLPAVNILEILL